MNRRSFLSAAGGLGLLASPLGAMAQIAPYNLSPGLPASPSDTVIVELANFNCSRCHAVNSHFDRLKDAARSRGVDLRFAPLVWERESQWPDRVYYSWRDLYPESEKIIRDVIFDGIHREGMRFEDLAQTTAYIVRRQITERALLINPNFDMDTLVARANTDIGLLSEIKASRLVEQSGAQELPVFMWIAGGEVLHVVSPDEAGNDPRAIAQLMHHTILSFGEKS